MSNEELHLVMGIHNREDYYIHSLVSLNSMLSRTEGDIRPHIFHDASLDAPSRGQFRKLAAHYGREIIFHDLTSELASLPFQNKWRYFSPGCLLRLFIPSLFTKEKVLYLDGDTVVTGDVFKILNSVKYAPEKSLWAVNDAFASTEHFSAHVKELGIAPDKYFNSGVLYFDIGNFNRKIDDLPLRASALLTEKSIRFPDQDILNIVTQNKDMTASLPISANFQIGYGRGDLPVEKLNNRIVHYTLSKPWEKVYPAGMLYWQEREKLIPIISG